MPRINRSDKNVEPDKERVKTVLRIVVGLLVFLLLAGGSAYLFRAPLAGWAVERALASAGIPEAEVRVSELTLSRTALAVASPDMSGEVATTYRLGELIQERRVKTLTLKGVEVSAVLSEAGKLSIPGLDLTSTGNENDRSTLPFRQLTVEDARVDLQTPEGDAVVTLDGAFDPETGVAASAEFRAARAGLSFLVLEEATGLFTLALDGNNPASLTTTLSSDIITPQGIVRDLALQGAADITDWRSLTTGKVPREGRGVLTISSASIGAAGTPALRSLAEGISPLSADLEQVVALGEINALLEDGVLTAALGDGPIELSGAEGSFLRISQNEAAPLLRLAGNAMSMAAKVETETPQLAGQISLAADKSGASDWRLEASGVVPRAQFADIALSADNLSVSGVYRDGELNVTAALAGLMKEARLGALTVADAPMSASFPVIYNRSSGVLSISGTEETAIRIERAHVRSGNGSVTANLGAAELIPENGPLLMAVLGEQPQISGGSAVRLSSLRAAAGETQLSAKGLRGDLSLNFDNATRSTDLDLALKGGSALVNDLLALGKISATGGVKIVPGDASGEMVIRRVMVVEAREAPRLAPIHVVGPVTLSRGTLSFDLGVRTPSGTSLGRVEGSHGFASGQGEAVFESGSLTFAPGELQPSGLVLPLLGIVGNATGSVTATARAGWGEGSLQTSAVVTPQDLSFTGPGVAVAKTSNVSGTLNFASLLPIQTDGLQSISVGSIDFGSIALPDGEVSFALPGDETLLVEEAVFPFFGGQMRAEDSVIGFGGESVTTLRAENIDLRVLLEFLDVDGLTGEGRVEGTLPLVVDPFGIRIDNGTLYALEPGIIRFTGPAATAAAQANEGARLAFDALEELRFRELTATINGALDGDLDFKFTFRGESAIDLDGDGAATDVNAPIILNTSVQVPLIGLIDQARLSTNTRRQLEEAQKQKAQE